MNSICYKNSVLANFCQLAPTCANIHLYSINLYTFRQLFLIYDMGEVGWGHFQNNPFGLYLLNSWTNLKYLCSWMIHFVPVFSQQHGFACTSAQSLEIFSPWVKFGVWAKFPRWISFFGIDSHRYTYFWQKSSSRSFCQISCH